MGLVVDANILFSFFNEKSKARELSTLSSIILYSPEFALEEINKHRGEILKRFSLSDVQFSLILKLLQIVINFVKSEEYTRFLPKAKEISPDPDDVDFFALALKLECDIWSNDTNLKEQSRVKVFSTKDLVESSKLL